MWQNILTSCRNKNKYFTLLLMFSGTSWICQLSKTTSRNQVLLVLYKLFLRQRSCNECASTFYIKYSTIIQSYLGSKSLRFRIKLFQGKLFWLDWLLPFVTLDLIIYFIIFERNIKYFEQCRIDIYYIFWMR